MRFARPARTRCTHLFLSFGPPVAGDDLVPAAAVLLLTLRGTSFVYQGEELGLDDAVVNGFVAGFSGF